MFNVWVSLTIFCTPPEGLPQHRWLVSWVQACSWLLLSLAVVPWYWHLKNPEVFCSNWAVLSPEASSGLSSWCQASSSFYGTFSDGVPTATEVVLSPMASPAHSSVLMTSLSFKTNATWGGGFTQAQVWLPVKVLPWPPLEPSFCVLPWKNCFPEDFPSMVLVSSYSLLISQPYLTNISCPSKAKVSHQYSWVPS